MPATVAAPVYSFTLRSVASRDELVFKSVVRVLQGKTRHQWHHTDDRQADLVLLGDHLSDFAPLTDDLGGRCVIHMSATAGYGFHGLSLPLRIADVIAQLDQAGDDIGRRSGNRAPATGTTATTTTTTVTTITASRDGGADLSAQRVALTRWPEAALLQRDIRYLKLATALTGQPVSIVELAARTQFPIQLCQGFVDTLKAGHLVRVLGGLAEGGELQMAGHGASINYTRKPETAHHGLIARIRSRLELFVGTSAAK